MEKKLSALLIEDSEDDALILLHTLKKAGYQVDSQRVDTEHDLINAHASQTWDIIFSDFSMPQFNGMQALKLIRERDQYTPFIFVSGTIGEERAVDAIKQGANDYIIKGNLIRLIPTIERSLEEVRVKKALEDSHIRFQHAFHYSGVSSALVDVLGHFIETNAAFHELLKYDESTLKEMTIHDIVDDEFTSTFLEAISSLMTKKIKSQSLELRIKHHDKRKLWIALNMSLIASEHSQATPYFIIQFQDKTEEHLFKEKLLYLKKYNALTGVMNRDSTIEYINNLIINQTYSRFSVFFVDLDRFKLINETYSESYGDNLLRDISQKLKSQLNHLAEIGYYGGNEFIIIASFIEKEDCEKVIYKIHDVLSEPFLIQSDNITLTASIGVSQYPNDAEKANTILKTASMAMRHCKNKGGNAVCYFNESMLKTTNKLKIENDLRNAVQNHELHIYYQPKINNQGLVSGLEALVRWKKNNTIIPPDQFIPIAEESGSIIEIGRTVLTRALNVFSTLSKNQMISENAKIAVNLSPRQFSDAKFIPIMIDTLQQYNLSPYALEIEITENALIHNFEECLHMINTLKKIGIQITIDDFGIGYSSLSYLKDLQSDCLKIDKSFVQTCLSDTNSQSIVSSTISLAHRLNLKVVAEGVETKGHHDFLLRQHCDEFQGYYFSRPLPENELITYLLEKR